jgi:hypothetical protein
VEFSGYIKAAMLCVGAIVGRFFDGGFQGFRRIFFHIRFKNDDKINKTLRREILQTG